MAFMSLVHMFWATPAELYNTQKSKEFILALHEAYLKPTDEGWKVL